VRKKLFVFFPLLIAMACSPSNPKGIPFEKKDVEQVSEIGDISKETFRPNLDILFVIDDSGSMSTHQTNLANNINLFADSIIKTKFLDYHVGVITSSVFTSPFSPAGGGKLVGNPKYVDRATPNGLLVLSQNLKVGTNGDATERFFDPLYMALTAPLASTFNAGFLRNDSYLAIIFVTDTDDQSANFSSQEIYDFLINLKGSQDRLFVGAAFIPDSEIGVCPGETFEIGNTDRLPDLFQLTGALTFSLCDPDYGQKLAEIGRVIATRAQTMYLRKVPKKGTIKVTVGTDEIPNHPKTGWTYNPVINGIEFGPDIDWETFPDNVFPQVDFEAIEFNQPAAQ
jgi:hypothetical protein